MAFATMRDTARAWACFDLINPVNHATSAAQVATYRVEPYVMAADVYAVPPHTGRGGWTWYTGSASWMYRLITESLLGLQLRSGALHFAPCIPAEWPGFSIQYRFGKTTYSIDVKRISTEESLVVALVVLLDGVVQVEGRVPLVDDHVAHIVEVRL